MFLSLLKVGMLANKIPATNALISDCQRNVSDVNGLAPLAQTAFIFWAATAAHEALRSEDARFATWLDAHKEFSARIHSPSPEGGANGYVVRVAGRPVSMAWRVPFDAPETLTRQFGEGWLADVVTDPSARRQGHAESAIKGLLADRSLHLWAEEQNTRYYEHHFGARFGRETHEIPDPMNPAHITLVRIGILPKTIP